jgi:hypothetical protein
MDFHCLFGDVSGDANYRSYFDFDGDGVINGFDLGQVRDAVRHSPPVTCANPVAGMTIMIAWPTLATSFSPAFNRPARCT